MTAPDFERRLVLAFGPLTPAELAAELSALAVVADHRQRVVDACAGRPSMVTGTADYGQRAVNR